MRLFGKKLGMPDLPMRRIIMLVGLMLLLMCGLVGDLLVKVRRSDMAKAATLTDNLATALAQDIARNLELYDLSIQGALAGAKQPSTMATPKELRQLILFGQAKTAPFSGHIMIIDKNGVLVADSTTLEPSTQPYTDRDYFRIHLQQPNFGLYISRPLHSRFDGQMILALSRRIDNPDGSFGGVVVGTLKLDYFRQLFQQIKLDRGAALTLFRNDGILIMREPYDEGAIGTRQDPPKLFDLASRAVHGEYTSVSPTDGVHRFYHYHRVGQLPLVQNVGLAADDLTAAWLWRAGSITAIMALACLTILLLILRLGGELQRREKAEQALRNMAEQDGLTGLANRRCFDRVLDAEWQQARTGQQPISLLMIDADHFKLYNDTFGHGAGDQALRQLARCMLDVGSQTSQLAARYGGEEFAMVLPNQDLEQACQTAELLKKAVQAMRLPHPETRLGHFSVSIGVASARPDARQDTAWLTRTADEALYRSKLMGRDRITCGPGHEETRLAS